MCAPPRTSRLRIRTIGKGVSSRAGLADDPLTAGAPSGVDDVVMVVGPAVGGGVVVVPVGGGVVVVGGGVVVVGGGVVVVGGGVVVVGGGVVVVCGGPSLLPLGEPQSGSAG